MPRTLKNHEVFEYVRDLHKRWADFDDGDLEDRIYKFSKYVLTKLPVERLYKENRWSIDDSLVDKYSKLTTPIPPIVYDKVDNEIIDGSHRIEVAYKLGFKFIDAYVGTRNNLVEA